MNRISVIMSVYQEPVRYIKDAIDSILTQTYAPHELIVIVDHPWNQEAIAFLNDYQSKHPVMKILINTENIGLARSLNRGIDCAEGEIIARMDADDVAYPERIEKELAFLQKGGYDVVSTLVDRIDEDGKVWGELKPFPNESRVITGMLPYKNVMIHPTVMMKKEAVDSLGGYRPYSSAQDYDLWLRMLTGGKRIGILNEKLLKFRMHQNSVTATRRYSQYVNEKHMKLMYRERLRSGKDSFTEAGLEAFLQENRCADKGYVSAQDGLMAMYRNGVAAIQSKKYGQGLKNVFVSLFRCECVRANLVVTVRSKIARIRYR